MRANPAVYLSTAVREIICQLTWSYPPPTCTARWGEQGAIPAVPLYQGLTWHPSPRGHPVLVGGSEIQGGAFLHISLLVIFSWSRITWVYTIISLLHVCFIAVSLKLSNTKPDLKLTVTQPSTRGSHILVYVACRSVCNPDQDVWSAKSVLDCLIVSFWSAWLLDFQQIKGQIVAASSWTINFHSLEVTLISCPKGLWLLDWILITVAGASTQETTHPTNTSSEHSLNEDTH